jgi:hypothetical protein
MKIPTKCMMLVAAIAATAGICAAQGNGGGGNASPKPAAGTVTSITAGAGLTGGTITTTGTITVDFGPTTGANTVSRSDHNHDSRYLKLAGGTLTGGVTLPDNGLQVGTNQIVTGSGRIGFGTAPNDAFVFINDPRAFAPVGQGHGANAGYGFKFLGANGGDTSDTDGIGGTGGAFQVLGGVGGAGDSGDNHMGGFGANLTVFGGGGGQGNNQPYPGGGQGGAISLRGGTGGNGDAKPGGQGGPVYIDGGDGGSGGSANGSVGDVFLSTSHVIPGNPGKTFVGGDLLFLTAGRGIVLKSPNGTVCKSLTLTDAGLTALTTVACP